MPDIGRTFFIHDTTYEKFDNPFARELVSSACQVLVLVPIVLILSDICTSSSSHIRKSQSS